MINITEVRTASQRRAFARFPLKLYKDCPYYVPSVYADEKNITLPQKNPMQAVWLST